MPERVEIGSNLGCCQSHLLCHLDSQLCLQFLFFVLAFFNPLSDHVGRLSPLQCLPEIFNGGIRFLDGSFDAFDGCCVPVGFTGLRYRGRNPLNVAICQQLAALQHHTILNSFFTNDLLFAFAPFEIIAGVVVICLARFSCTTVTGHHLPAVATEQLCGEQILFPPSSSGGCFFVAIKDIVDPLKQLIFDDTRHTARRFLTFVEVITDVTPVVQNAMDAVFIKGFAKRSRELSAVQITDNVCNCFSTGIPFKNLPDNLCFFLIHIVPTFGIHLIAQTRIAAIGQTLLRIDLHATANLLGKLRRVVFSHTFQNTFHQNAAGIITDIFPCGDHSHTVLFQFCFVDGAVVAVARKAVKLIYKNALKGMFVTVGNHPLKLGTAVGGSTLGTVNVLPNNEIAVVFGILIAGMELSLNRLLGLAMAGVAGVDDNIHCFASPSICSSVSLSRAFIGEAGSKHISTNFCIWGSFCWILGLYSYSFP